MDRVTVERIARVQAHILRTEQIAEEIPADAARDVPRAARQPGIPLPGSAGPRNGMPAPVSPGPLSQLLTPSVCPMVAGSVSAYRMASATSSRAMLMPTFRSIAVR